MTNIVDSFIHPSNQTFIAIIVALSGLRVFIEFTPLVPENWPISKKWSQRVGRAHVEKFHKTGLYICIGQIILWAPNLLMG
ncbi:hypothetical protein [Bacteriovorax sp. DB6_IX]|uniref:hypothetical protein n=1 Tax=Bacteriovorax sp. DB6_IX TaxID=1353530 RepID=UPI00038A3834|nr:hypothetical protein [Bacteriovorax sp. DB6_IX]EQC48592.1 hypothetical protein M901_1037 [Bacteriovorax sp. DB6_IX]